MQNGNERARNAYESERHEAQTLRELERKRLKSLGCRQVQFRIGIVGWILLSPFILLILWLLLSILVGAGATLETLIAGG